MDHLIAFKSGKDLGEGGGVRDEETVTCVSCGAVESDAAAFQAGWQLEPPVCPKCLTWSVVESACGCGRPA